MDALNLHPIITPLFVAASGFYLASFWLARREHYMVFKTAANFFEVLAMAVAGLWTGVAVGAVSLFVKASAIWSYKLFPIWAKVLLVLVAFVLTVALQEGEIGGWEYLPLVTFIYGRSMEQFAPNKALRIGSLPVQILFMVYFAFAQRWDGVILEMIHILNTLYTWIYRRDKLAA